LIILGLFDAADEIVQWLRAAGDRQAGDEEMKTSMVRDQPRGIACVFTDIASSKRRPSAPHAITPATVATDPMKILLFARSDAAAASRSSAIA
jgi:hypothetical protein